MCAFDYFVTSTFRFKETFVLNPELPEENNVTLQSLLESRLNSLSARNHQEMTFVSDLSVFHFQCEVTVGFKHF